MWILRLLSLVATMLMILASASGGVVAQTPSSTPLRRVLVLYSDERLLPANIIVDEAIRTTFAADPRERDLNRNSKRHTCPHCGAERQTHTLLMKQNMEAQRNAIPKWTRLKCKSGAQPVHDLRLRGDSESSYSMRIFGPCLISRTL
jgi:hypothetical protein